MGRATVAAWRAGRSVPSVPHAFAQEALTGIKARWWMSEEDVVVIARAEAEAHRLARTPPTQKDAGPHNDWVLPGQLALFPGVTRAAPAMPAALVGDAIAGGAAPGGALQVTG